MSNVFGEIRYREAFNIIESLYKDAIRSLHLNPTQAFAYAYDETERLRDRNVASTWIVTLTALFVCAKKYGSQINRENLFTNDVVFELSRAYTFRDPVMFCELEMNDLESEEFLSDARIVVRTYLSDDGGADM